MKYFLVFLVVCVALATAAPQFFAAWPGYTGVVPARTTLVAGPTVVNGLGARYVSPGYVGPAFW